MHLRAKLMVMAGSALLAALGAIGAGVGQERNIAPAANGVDLDKSILGQIKEAYKSVYEAPQDFRDELKGYYKQPTTQRETAMLREVRRLYRPTAEQEQAILAEIRKAYAQWSPEQENRIFLAIDKAVRLPEGAVPPTVLANQITKFFAKLDANGDGVLVAAEMPDALREVRTRWDADSDGAISKEEFAAYFQNRLRWMSEQVAAGKIELGLKRGGPDLSNLPSEDEEEEPRPRIFRAGNLPEGIPAWFIQLDTDQDGQIALYEWHAARKPLDVFAAIDRDDDGLMTPEEVMRYIALNNEDPGIAANKSPNPTKFAEKKAKKKD